MKRVPIGLTTTALAWSLLIPTAVGTPPAAPVTTPATAVIATQAPPPGQLSLAAYDLGTMTNPSNVRGRDEGVSALVGGKSIWAFGDTLSLQPDPQNAPNLRVRTSTGALNVQGFLPTDEPLDGTGFPSAPLIPLTAAEQAHVQANPGRRAYVWPSGIIARENTTSLIWWHSGIHAAGVDIPGSTRAGLADITAGATTATRRAATFTGQDCKWGSPVLDADGVYVYVYATPDEVGTSNQRTSCPDREMSPFHTMVGRVKLSEAGTRSAYRFWNGSAWSTNPLTAVTVHSLLNANVVWDEANSVYVAIGGTENASRYSTAPSPEGPWSRMSSGDHHLYVPPIPRETLPQDGYGNYAWRFHREHAGAGGAVQLVSYHHELPNPAKSGRIHLLAVDTRPDAATKRRDYVVRMYQTFLGFAPGSSDTTYWANRLANRNITVPEFIRQLTASVDGRRHTVRRAYLEALGRSASSTDQAYWADQLALPGWGHDILVAKLASSAEGRNRYPTTTAYIEAMYQMAFGRSVDSGGLAYWSSQLPPTGTTTHYNFVRQLMQSHEGGQRQAALAYTAILGRSATALQRDGVADVLREATKIRIAVASTAEAIGVPS